MNISQLGKILKATNRLNGIKEFNASLPIRIEVKQELSPIRYLLKMGNRELETKSYKHLEVGAKYLGEIQQHSSRINIKNLSKIPTIFENTPEESFLPDDKSIDKYKSKVLEHLANSTNKNDFLFYANILLALNKNILHFFIKDKNKKSIHQTKFEKNRIKFYSFFSNLGAIEGELIYNKLYYLNLVVEFQSSFYIIRDNIDDLKEFKISIQVGEPKPLFEKTEQNLLNLKV